MQRACQALFTSTLTILYIALCMVLIDLSAKPATAQSITPLCNPKIVANLEVVTPAQRKAGGNIAQPPAHRSG
jgi:hypothetical protein